MGRPVRPLTKPPRAPQHLPSRSQPVPRCCYHPQGIDALTATRRHALRLKYEVATIAGPTRGRWSFGMSHRAAQQDHRCSGFSKSNRQPASHSERLVAMGRNPTGLFEHPAQVHEVPGHKRHVAVGEVILRAARPVVQIGRSWPGLPNPAGVGLRRNRVPKVLQAVGAGVTIHLSLTGDLEPGSSQDAARVIEELILRSTAFVSVWRAAGPDTPVRPPSGAIGWVARPARWRAAASAMVASVSGMFAAGGGRRRAAMARRPGSRGVGGLGASVARVRPLSAPRAIAWARGGMSWSRRWVRTVSPMA
jgi:hypothetical protein